MELYQEAFKANEDIYALLNLSKKTPNPKLMANYYQKQALVFWMNRNYLFHAAALFRLFYISKEQKKNITADEIVKLASKVVLATLAIPLAPNRTNIDQLVEIDDSVIDKNNRILSNLLGLSNPPTRALLIKDLVRFGIIHHAPPELKDLFQWLEIEFDPLKLCNRIQQCIDFLIAREDYPELCQYIPLIKEITIVRLVKEISQVYEAIKISRLLELAPFVDSFQLEYLVLKIACRNDLQVRIDHKMQCFRFGAELNVSQREEIIDGPHLQSMISECVRNLLVHYSSALNKAFNVIQPDNIKLKNKDLAKEISKAYMLASSKDHIRLLNRQQIIEERKEMLENQSYLKETEEKKLLEEKLQKFREAEKERLQKEAGERAKQRLLQEESEMKKKIVMEKIEQLKKTGIGSKIFEEMAVEELEKLDPDELLNKHFAQIEREKKDMQTKLKNQERKVDHYERAKRREEISLLLQEYNQTKLKDVEFWDQHEKERINSINEERALAVQERERLMRLRDDKESFLEHLKKTRAFEHQEKYEEFNKKCRKKKRKD
ncbi:hypothetical protein CEXT_184881 [Caerostris extrusa]|nr:hypothetical protein CEXT_184881 [Caerostris extrusa]